MLVIKIKVMNIIEVKYYRRLSMGYLKERVICLK